MVLRTTAAGNLEVQDPTSEGWVPLQSVVPPPNGLPVELKATQNTVIEGIQALLTTIQETTSALQVLATSIRDSNTSADSTLATVETQLETLNTSVETRLETLNTSVNSSVQNAIAATEQSQKGAVSLTHQTLALSNTAYLVSIPSTAKSFAISCRNYSGDTSGDVWIATTATAATTGSNGTGSAKRIDNGMEFYQEGLNLSSALELYLCPAVNGIRVVIEIWS